MKIAILTGETGTVRTGVHNYIFNLVEKMSDFKDLDLTLITQTQKTVFPGLKTINPSCPYPRFSSFFWSQCLTIQKKIFQEFDLVHNPAHYPLLVKPASRYVCTIHDLTPILFPQFHPRWRCFYTGLGIPRLVRSADKIIADSRQTKRDIIARYHIPEDRISVIYLGASDGFRPLEKQTVDAVRKKYRLDWPFILFIGNLEPRKNIPNLVRAFARCRNQHPELRLVIVGSRGWMFQDIFRMVSEEHIEQSVRFLDYVPHEDLPALYNAATTFVYVPFYEGFGLPPLEAMQCGTPIITSNTSSLPEIVGNGGIMVDPKDVSGLAEKISILVSDEDARRDNSRYNLFRCREFSWDKCARETREVYREVCEK